MRFCVLGSGSKGNSTFVQAGGTALLIDSGFSGVDVGRRLHDIGVEAADLSAILITHEHTDHIRGVSVLSRKFHLPVFVNAATLKAGVKGLNNLYSHREFFTGTTFSFNNLQVHPFSVSHDAADPVGFIISDGRWSVGYCTDTGTVSRLMRHRLSGCHGLILESNHDPGMLQNGPYPLHLQQRIKSNKGHLANLTAAKLARDLRHPGLQHIVFAHISHTNNRPRLVEETINSVLQDRGPNAKFDMPAIPVSLASQDVVGRLVCLTER